MSRWVLLCLLLLAGQVFAAPVVMYTDIVSAPRAGFAGDPGRGAWVSVYGRGFGAGPGASSFVSVGDTDLMASADYHTVETWGQKGVPARGIERITFQLNSGVALGEQPVTVTVNGVRSNPTNIHVTANRIQYIDPNAAAGGNGSIGSPWNNFVAFMAQQQPGDVLYVRDGRFDTYQSGSSTDLSVVRMRNDTGYQGGTAGNNISIVSYPGETGEIDSWDPADTDMNRGMQILLPYITVAKLRCWSRQQCFAFGDGSDHARAIANHLTGTLDHVWGTGMITTNDGMEDVSGGGNQADILGNLFECSNSAENQAQAIPVGCSANQQDHAIYAGGCPSESGSNIGWNDFRDVSYQAGPIISINHQQNRCPGNVYAKSHRVFGNWIDCTYANNRAILVYDLSYDGGSETLPEPTYIYNNVANSCGYDLYNATYASNAANTEFFHNVCVNSGGRCLSINHDDRVYRAVSMNNIWLRADDGDTHEYQAIGDNGHTEIISKNNIYWGVPLSTDRARNSNDSAPITNVDPQIVLDWDNRTYSMNPAALNLGEFLLSNQDLRFDMNGTRRPLGGQFDHGAIEFGVAPPSVILQSHTATPVLTTCTAPQVLTSAGTCVNP